MHPAHLRGFWYAYAAHSPGGETDIREGLKACINMLNAPEIEGEKKRHKVVLLISDGA